MVIQGNILKIDLTSKSIQKEKLTTEFLEKYLGGRGIGVKILVDTVDKNTDPLSPENVLILSTGTLAGTFAPASARLTVTSKSPETGIYCKSSVGGHFSPELKFAGYDVLVISGASKNPVYIHIQDDSVEIKDARHLWGKDVRETDAMLKKELGDEKTSVMSIGPAGENLVKYSAIMVNIYRAIARGGMGTIMGSKKLKAIAVRGRNSVKVAHPHEFKEIALKTRESLRDDQERFFRYFYFGTQRGLVGANNAGFNSARNFQTGYIQDAYKVGGEYIREKYLSGETGCGSCVLCCGTSYNIEKGPFEGTHSEGPEWEACNTYGARMGNVDTEQLLKINEITNIYGLDLSSAGSVIAFAMELYEKGILTRKETDGLDLSWGNMEAATILIKKIAYREGFGNVLAESIRDIAAKFKGAKKYAMEIKGLPLTSVDPRLTIPYALAFAVNPRGGDHLHTEIMCQFGSSPEHVEIATKISGTPQGAKPLSFEGKAKMVKYHEQVCCASDALGVCFMHTLSSHRTSPEILAALFENATGIPMNADKLLNACERILNLERMFNVREGLDGKDDVLPERMFEEEIPDGPSKGLKMSREKFNLLLQEYYQLHGWDSNGIPDNETLQNLGLEDYSTFKS